MTRHHLNAALIACGLAALLGASHLLDTGPSEAELATATAADLMDAQAAAANFERDYRECQRLRGPSAELIQIEGTDHYVCREGQIQPTPAAVLQRYAALGVAR